MELDDDQEHYIGGSGRPIFGAIFMANRKTKKECLKRKLFGLPPPQANFVKKVKFNMMLFLFEFEERKLYGVFQASSDGAMNIVPNAFTSSGKQFPAQIRVKTIWYCEPLTETDFRPAIKDNYYTANKFHLGLSEDQVAKLLLLFESRKIRFPKSRSPLPRERQFNRSVSSDYGNVRGVEDDEHISHDNRKNRLLMDNEPASFARDPGFLESDSNISSVSGKTELYPLGHDNDRAWSPHRSRNGSLWRDDPYAKSLGDSLPPMRSNQGVFTSLGDYIPLDFKSHPDQSPYTQYKNVDLTNSRDQEGLTFRDPSLVTNPSSTLLSFERENLSSSFNPGTVSPYVPDHQFPASSQHDKRPYSTTQETLTFRDTSWASDTYSRRGNFSKENLSSSFTTGTDPPYVPEYRSPSSLLREGSSSYSNTQEDLAFHDPSLSTDSYSRRVNFRRENSTSSFNAGTDQPYILDHRSPVSLRHEGSPYSNIREGFSFHDPSLSIDPYSRRTNLGRESLRSFFNPGADPPYVPEHHSPASLQHEGPQYSNSHPFPNSHLDAGDDPLISQKHNFLRKLEQDDPTHVRKDDHAGLRSLQHEGPQYSNSHPFSNSHLDAGDDPLISQKNNLRRKLEQDDPTHVRKDDHVGLRSDVQKKRTSVFARLSNSQKGSIEDSEDPTDMTADKLMKMLHQSQKHWRSLTVNSRHKIQLADVQSSRSNSSMQSLYEKDPLDNLEQQCDDVVVEDTIVDFKRRSKIREVEGVTDGRVEEGDGLLRKRRKLSRPSFVSGGTHDMGNDSPNLNVIPLEKLEYKDESSQAYTDGGVKESSQDVRVQDVVPPVCFEPNSDKMEIHEDKACGKNESLGHSSGVEVNQKETSQNSVVLNNSGKTEKDANLHDFKVTVEGYVQELSKGTGNTPQREGITQDTHIYSEGDDCKPEKASGDMELEKKLADSSFKCESNRQKEGLHNEPHNEKVVIQSGRPEETSGSREPENRDDETSASEGYRKIESILTEFNSTDSNSSTETVTSKKGKKLARPKLWAAGNNPKS